ncbi:MAG: c-type cytochrome, partial [Deltaproteobacteria bacterium]|nr:c-type cytochrome [Nannocystaceae bacterium]
AGRELFDELGCASCHVPSWRTGSDAIDPALADQLIWPFTDLLLHDLGDALADGRPDFAADGRSWRTPPLWGLGLVETVNRHDTMLHDGRARGYAEAILWHGGEAEPARESFRMLDAEARAQLVAFLASL